MFIGGKRVGKLHNINMYERDRIIKSLPDNLKYSYKCIRGKYSPLADDKRYDLWIFRNDNCNNVFDF